ncbi:MAG: hypothetical protein RIT81_41390 [Deltaproteobacteria bacterium]
MPGSPQDLEDIRRALARIARLAGVVVPTREGPLLFEGIEIVDPRLIVDEVFTSGLPSAATVRAAFRSRSKRTPIEVTPRWLAAAQRDLHRVRAQPRVLDWVKEASSVLGKYRHVDAAWLDAHQAHLDRVGGELVVRDDAPGFDTALRLIDAVHGASQAGQVRRVVTLSAQHSVRLRRRAERRLSDLVAALRSEDARSDAVAAAAMVRSVAGPSRRIRRRFVRAVVEYVLGTDAGHAFDDAPGAPIEERVQTIGRAAIASIPSTRSEAYLHRLQSTLATYALTFSWDGPARALGPRELDGLDRRADAVLTAFAGHVREFADVVELLQDRKVCKDLALAGRLNDVLTVGEVRSIFALGLAHEVSHLLHAPDLARGYGRWIAKLAPHFEGIGAQFSVTARQYEQLARRAAKQSDLALLAHCLISHHATPSQETIQADLANLDATLGLFRAEDTKLPDIVAKLRASQTGIGRQLYPDFAAWLDDDEHLDRFLTLAGQAGRTELLPAALRGDYERESRTERERRFLAALPEPTERQRARLAHLASAPPADPRRTRARIRRRIDGLSAEVYRTALDQQILELLHRAFRIRPAKLDGAWRDAVRFYLATHRNHELLRALLHHATAHPGEPIDRERNEARVWLERAASRIDVEAWLAPRRRTVELAGRPHTIAVEHDPLQVLRMGIPFSTCLSIQRGSNAAATVINAFDVNKQVLYLRNANDVIVGRQLIAISDAFQLLTYHVYLSEQQDADQARDAFVELCLEIARDTGAALTTGGAPEQLHEGFWYCDPPEAIAPTISDDAVAAYCAWLGRPEPDGERTELNREAAGWRAAREGDPMRAAQLLARERGPAFESVARTLHVDADRDALEQACASAPELAVAVAHNRARRDGLEAAFALIERAPTLDWRFVDALPPLTIRNEPNAAIADAWLRLGERGRRINPFFDNHGVEHSTFYTVHPQLRGAPVRSILALADRAAALWDWIVEESNGYCAHCRVNAIDNWLATAERSFALEPDPDAVIACLRSSRRSQLAHRIALRLAARFAMDGSAPNPTTRHSAPAVLPSLVRLLRKLADKTPALDGVDLRVAVARHAIDRQDLAAHVPASALGDLLLHLDVAPLADTPVDLEAWPPNPWSLYVARRGTELRDHVRGKVPEQRTLVRWLVSLGDVDGVRDARSPLLDAAGFVRDQLDGVPASLAVLDEPRAECIVDPALTEVAARRLDEDEAWSLKVLGHGLPQETWHDLLVRRLDQPTEAVLKAWAHALLDVPAPVLSAPIVDRLAQHPSLADRLAEALARPIWDNVWSHFLRYAHLDGADALFARVLERSSTSYASVDVATDEDVDRLAAMASRLSVERWLDVAMNLPDHRALARFLDASRATLEEHREEILRTLEGNRRLDAEWIYAAAVPAPEVR